MGILGLGSVPSSGGSQYDFTKMTNAQLLSAAQTLGSEGKISQSDANQLSFIAQGVDTVPISGNSPTVAQTLSSTTQHNFLAELRGDDMSANLAGSVGGALYDSMLKDLQTYQAGSIEQTAKTISTQV